MAESGTAPSSGRTMPPGWEGEGRRGRGGGGGEKGRGGGRGEEGEGRRGGGGGGRREEGEGECEGEEVQHRREIEERVRVVGMKSRDGKDEGRS